MMVGRSGESRGDPDADADADADARQPAERDEMIAGKSGQTARGREDEEEEEEEEKEMMEEQRYHLLDGLRRRQHRGWLAGRKPGWKRKPSPDSQANQNAGVGPRAGCLRQACASAERRRLDHEPLSSR